MSLDFFSIFNLDVNFRKEDLDNGYNNRVRSIMENTNLSSFDKRVLLEHAKEQYIIAYNDMLKRRFFSTENLLVPSPSVSNFIRNTLSSLNTLSDIYSYDLPLSFKSYEEPTQNQDPIHSSSTIYRERVIPDGIHSSSTIYRERVMPDGSRIVLKETSTNNNGDITKKTTSYRKLSSGETEPIEYEEGIKQLENKVLV
jgi:hypothetical protein